METIIGALISAAAAIAVCLISSAASHRKFIAELESRDELQAYRIKQLEEKVDKHNNLVERMYRIEDRANVQDEKIKVVNHRIEDLETKVDTK